MEENKVLSSEDLKKVNAGAWYDPAPVPEGWQSVEVKDGAVTGSALCPYDGAVLDYMNYSPSFADWLFHCPTCKKWFAKKWDGTWYVSENEPE